MLTLLFLSRRCCWHPMPMGAGECDHGGYGIVAAYLGALAIKEVLRAGVAPLRLAARLESDSLAVHWVRERFRATLPRSMAPLALLAQATWVNIAAGRWKWSDHTTLGESRAILRVLQIVGGTMGAPVRMSQSPVRITWL